MMGETKKDLTNSKLSHEKFHLTGVHSYDILRNPTYSQAFQYFHAGLEDRKDYIIDGDEDDTNDCAQSDLVRIILNLAFLTEEDVSNMSFDPEGLQMLEKKN